MTQTPSTPNPSSNRLAGCDRTFWLTTVGFGLYLGWSMMGASASLLPDANFDAVTAMAIHGPLERLLWIGALVAAALLSLLNKTPRFQRTLALIAGIGTVVGTASVYGVTALQGSPALMSAAQLPIVVSSLFIGLWGARLCAFRERNAILCVCCASAISFLAVLACMPLGPVLQAALHIALPAASCALFLASIPTPAATPADQQPATASGLVHSLPLRAFIGLGLFGTTVVLLQAFSEQKTEMPDELLWIVAGLAVNVVVLAVALLTPDRLKASSLSRPILPLFVVSTFLVFATDFGQQALEVFFVACSWAYFRMFSWIIWRVGAQRSHNASFCTVAIGQIFLTCGTTLGSLAHAGFVQTGIPQLAAMATICTLSVLVAVLFLDTHYVAELADAKPLFDPSNPAACERCVDVATARFGLSDKERSVARLLVQGATNEEIQADLVIATATLRTHLRNLYRKTQTHSREELVVLLRSLE